MTINLVSIEVRRMQERQVDKEEIHVQVQESDSMHASLVYPSTLLGLEKMWWLFLNGLSFYFGACLIAYMMSGWVHKNYGIHGVKLYWIPLFIKMIYFFIPFTIHMRYRGMPYRILGRHGKAAIDSIVLVAAIMLRIYFPYDGSYFKLALILVMVSLTLQLHGWGQSLHLTWDISIDDVLLHVFMELGTYLIFEGLMFVFLVFLFSCVICYRFFHYSVPSTPESIKKDLESLPC